MAIITISRGTFSGGIMLAECLSRELGYRSIDRDQLVEKAATPRVPPQELHAALEQPPVFPGRFNHKRYVYLALIQAALMEEVRSGRAIYHGLAGHLLLRGVPGLLRLRIIAPMDFRVRMAAERLNISAADAVPYIEKIDRDRRQWTRFLYGVDWGDPALYDLLISLERVDIRQACAAVTAMLAERDYEFSAEDQAAMDDLVLASRVRAELAVNPFTANLEVEVKAHRGSVTISGELFEEVEHVHRVAGDVPGITELAVLERPAPVEVGSEV